MARYLKTPADIARDLRVLADRFAMMDTTELPNVNADFSLFLVGGEPAERVAAIDMIGLALFGLTGETSSGSFGEDYHTTPPAQRVPGAPGISINVRTSIPRADPE
ncbi:hypothetical protein GCM10023322_60110 [Rugosimonospora acidiphila]|uniref:Uncharacterized protein n=1 Tax=Rugosimonospora acidiphila TaxID=556531 RepID=A0ABP9SG07_9ACTN